ncbi:Na+/H+ antiporter NhaA [Desulfopila sp. IMCC35008]|uniref:Na+/H+ antiporter NhaA n=1 Tax=Desulfopila sp. IMCC35008 TaxID=2653858 RepID=UPI0013D5BBFC|nr:Na+/H+ antiporter NhaA [Desulfopila sp. IMCC35008]
MEKTRIPMYKDGPPQNQVSPEPFVAKLITTSAFQSFFNTISNGGFLLFAAACVAFIWSNVSPQGYLHFWHQEFAIHIGSAVFSHSLAHWVNDALMTFFFFTVGLEIKREMLVGGLSDIRKAILPVAAAVGGMVVPAIVYWLFTSGGEGTSGWGIPMATDIAFSLAVLSTLGKRVPFGIRIFLTAFAIADDLGAIMVIALFYTPQIHLTYLAGASAVCLLLFLLNRFWVRTPLAYVAVGLLLWVLIAHSGLHATITGVIVAMFIPAKGKFNTDVFMRLVRERLEDIRCKGEACGYTIMENRKHLDAVHGIHQACLKLETPLQRMEHGMEPWIAYLVLPLFALANGGVVLGDLDLQVALLHPVTIGVAVGLGLGKPVGIVLFTWLATKIMRVDLIDGVSWSMITGAGFLGGIGFTMSLFIAALSFDQPVFQEYAKIGIIAGSIFGGIAGYVLLRTAVSR